MGQSSEFLVKLKLGLEKCGQSSSKKGISNSFDFYYEKGMFTIKSDWPILTSIDPNDLIKPFWSKSFKLLTATKDEQELYKSKRNEIYSLVNPGEICLKLSELLKINVYIYQDSTQLGIDYKNIKSIYPSPGSNKCIPLIHWTAVNKDKKVSKFQSWRMNKFYSKVDIYFWYDMSHNKWLILP